MPNARTVRGPFFESTAARNLRRLIEHQAGGSVNAWAARYSLNKSTVNRICNGTRDVSVSTLENLADAAGYRAWQLLHEDFDPRIMPPLLDARAMRVAAIYASLTSQLERDRLEAIVEQFEPDCVSKAKP